MNRNWIGTALGVVAVLSVASGAYAQKKSNAEVSLVGIKLYDTGLRVVSLYGTPDAVEAVNAGGAAIGPGGGGPGAGGPGAGRGGFTPPGRGGGPGNGSGAAGVDFATPFDFSNDMLPTTLNLQGKGGPMMPGSAPGPSSAGTGGGPGVGSPVGPGGGPGMGGAGGTGGGGRILYTRWIYNRNGSKYGFVLDKSNRVVQIEAIGLSNPKVKTKRGVTFGSTFAQLIKKYNAPDGYEINGENVVVRFLVKNKVAFRLSRLGPNKPQVVTGIVVAAGKT